MSVEIYDIENWSNFFSYASEDKFFVIHESRNDLDKFVEHFQPDRRYVGFNNLNYDYPLCYFIWKNYKYIKDFEINDLLALIRDENNRIIGSNWSRVEGPHEQCDLFKIHHFDNKNKSTSLKKVQCVLGMDNVQDLPFPLDYKVKAEDIPLIQEYNQGSDVKSTRLFYEHTLPKINLRESFKERFGLDCLNYSDSKIGAELVLKRYCELTGKDPFQVRKLRTYRDSLKLSECLFPIYDFKFPGFDRLYHYLYNKTVKGTDEISEPVFFKGVTILYGSGGFHGCCPPGIYSEDDTYIIMDLDVGSLYPYINYVNSLHPAHLGPEFVTVLKGIIDERMHAKKNKDSVVSDGLKLAANSIVGNYNQEFSYLYDMKPFLTTTLNGQLLLTQVIEIITGVLPKSKLLQVNTDGATFMIRRADLELFRKTYQKWMSDTGYILEEASYKKMIIRDVNNYLAVKHDGKTKGKGIFEVNKKVGDEIAFHKDHSNRISSIALEEYYTKDIPIEETITNEKDIRKFLIHSRVDYGDRFEMNDQVQQRTIRYYISKTGSPLFKIMKPNPKEKGRLDRDREKNPDQLELFQIEAEPKERVQREEVGYLCRIMNKIDEPKDLDYQYYIDQCSKITNKCKLYDTARI